MTSVAKQIGNAVPPPLAARLAEAVLDRLREVVLGPSAVATAA